MYVGNTYDILATQSETQTKLFKKCLDDAQKSDPAQYFYPVIQLCSKKSSYLPGDGTGWCKALNPPGFM